MKTNNIISLISNEDDEEIAEASEFFCFLSASDINRDLETFPCMNLSTVLEDESNVNIELCSHVHFEELKGNSTLLDSVEVSVELAEDGETGAKAGREGYDPFLLVQTI